MPTGIVGPHTAGKAQGKGIFLFNKLAQINDWKKDHRWKSVSPQGFCELRWIALPGGSPWMDAL